MPFHQLNEDQFREAFWTESPVPLSIVGRDGRFVAVNSAWTELLGYARTELQGRHFREITHPSDLEGDESEVARLISDPEAGGYSLVKRYIHKHGPTLWVELHVRAVRDDGEALVCFAVCAIPLPVLPQPLPLSPQPAVWRSAVLCVVDLVKAHPRLSLSFATLAVVAVGRIPLEPLLQFFVNYILKT